MLPPYFSGYTVITPRVMSPKISSLVFFCAILFMASDGLIATERFLLAAISPLRVWMRYAVWVLYYAAQLAITLGFLLG